MHHQPLPRTNIWVTLYKFIFVTGLYISLSQTLNAQSGPPISTTNSRQQRTNNIPCDNWLRLPSYQSYVSVGDLDIPGDKITVEAIFTRTAPYSNGYNWAGDLVSKHNTPVDNNYLLRPNNAEITTSNGFFTTPPICEIELNKTYHATMTYDGSSLKFYRNGILMSSVAASGDMLQNNFQTRIGLYDALINNTNLIGYINEVRIWNVVRTPAEIQSYVNIPLPNPPSQTGLLAYYTFDNLINKQGNPVWNGVLGGNAVLNQANPFCTVTGPDCSLSCPTPGDYSFKRSICNPTEIVFETNSIGYSFIKWEFGDGNTITNTNKVNHTYSTPGIYTVKMIQGLNNCYDTITKNINIDIENDPDFILTKDTAICPGQPVNLDASTGLDFCWSPASFLSTTSSSQPVATPTQDITYFYTTRFLGSNLVTNSDFSMGNTGFNSHYLFSNNNTGIGQYTVDAIPESWNTGFSPCRDHTGTGSPNMMIVNGASLVNANIWSQTITVAPNTNYVFSTWIQSLASANPAQFSFTIDNIDIGDIFSPGNNSCIWKQYFVSWNSGNKTSITIGIRNKNTGSNGNDFALDDISFSEEIFKRDSVKITMKKIDVTAVGDGIVCQGSTVNLNATGAVNYVWSPANGLTNPSIPNPVATVFLPVQYIVTGTDLQGCIGKDTIYVDTFPKPLIITANDTTICRNSTVQLYANGGVSYTWSPTATLDNPNISNPTASPLSNTKYYVEVADANNCTYLDSVQISINPDAIFTVGPAGMVCQTDSMQLNAGGGTTYLWQPAIGLSDPGIPNPKASPSVSTDYMVTINDDVCGQSAILTTRVEVSPIPVVNANSSNDIDCSTSSSNLSATGSTNYTWTPTGSLSNPNIANPIATPAVTTDYVVMGTNAAGCKGYDTVTVKVSNSGEGSYLMPSAFTPNNDGLNDCYGIKYWGAIQKLEFSIYNRWGERIFYTTDPSKCWDGTYKGIKLDSGVFVYMITAKTFCNDNVSRKGTFTLVR